MRITIEKLRAWIVVLGVFLVLSLIVLFAYARYRVRKIGQDLPQKMGLEIQQSTNNFTISKSSKGRTLFVLHAAKAVQYKNAGRAVLHDVSIELYGPDGSATDRISGSEFDYDPSTKTVRADGTVDILLSDPRAHASGPAANLSDARSSQDAVHVKTQGLVFNQETQIASTGQALTFQQDGSSGSARGAVYDGNKGTLSLTSDVLLNAQVDGDPVKLQARSASFDRSARQMFFIQASIDFQQQHGDSDEATIFFRPNGKADHVRAEGHVHVRSDDGNDVRGSVGTVVLDAAGALQQARLDGGLLLVSQGPARSVHVNSNSGVFTFVPASKSDSAKPGTAAKLQHVRLTGAVSAVDQQDGLGADIHGSETRETRAGQIDVDMKSGSTGRILPDRVLAVGKAEVTIHAIHGNAPQQLTRLAGEQIFATLADGHSIATLRSIGNASLEQSTPGGLSQKSHGDVLTVDFAGGPLPGPPVKPAQSHAQRANGIMSNGSQIKTALLSGHAVMVQEQGSSSGSETTVADADHISYRGDTDTLKLSGGNPHIRRKGSDLGAAAIEFNHSTGDATASGGVKASYAANAAGDDPTKTAAPGEITHVIADHASLDHAKDETTFYGTPAANARMWQASNSINAPRIVISRLLQSLVADGGVKANFSNTSGTRPGADSPSESRQIQTTSRMLVYSGGERKVTLTGGVQAHEAEGMISAAAVDLYLNQGAMPASSAVKGPRGPGGQVSRLVAQQNVRLVQGARTGTGEKLVYTADDGNFILTGTTAAPPLLSDREHGTVTGSSLIFNTRDDSVVVNRGQAPTATDTRTKSDPHNKGMNVGGNPAGKVQ